MPRVGGGWHKAPVLFSEVSDGTDRVWPRSLAWGWALHTGRQVWAAPGLQGWPVCVCTPVLFPVVLAPDVAERVPPARATAPPAASQVHSPPQAHQDTCSCCVPAAQLGSQCVCLSLPGTSSLSAISVSMQMVSSQGPRSGCTHVPGLCQTPRRCSVHARITP